MMKNIDDIIQIEESSKYNKKIQILSNVKKANTLYSDDFTIYCLNKSKEENKVISLELCDSGYWDLSGIVINIDNETVELKSLDDYGEFDGTKYINILDITNFSYDSEDEQALLKLFLFNSKGKYEKKES